MGLINQFIEKEKEDGEFNFISWLSWFAYPSSLRNVKEA